MTPSVEAGLSSPRWVTVEAIASALEISVAELAALAEKLDR